MQVLGFGIIAYVSVMIRHNKKSIITIKKLSMVFHKRLRSIITSTQNTITETLLK